MTQLDRIERKLDRLFYQLRLVEVNMDLELQALADAVAKDNDATNSAITLIQGLATQLQQFAGDPAKVKAFADQISSTADSLAAAVVANTPAAP